jgi:hypothetical protein
MRARCNQKLLALYPITAEKEPYAQLNQGCYLLLQHGWLLLWNSGKTPQTSLLLKPTRDGNTFSHLHMQNWFGLTLFSKIPETLYFWSTVAFEMQKDPAYADPNWWLPHSKMYNHMLLQCHSSFLTHTTAKLVWWT